MKPMIKRGIFAIFLVAVLLCLNSGDVYSVSAETEEFSYYIYNEKAYINGYIGSKEHVEIPSEIKGYPVVTVKGMRKNKIIKSIVIPETVTGIEDFTFAESSVEKVTFLGKTRLGGNAFSDCVDLKEVIIGNGTTVLPEYVFSGCTNLVSVSLPDSLEQIGDLAFFGCSSLQVELPKNIKYIGENAFRNTAFEKVTISKDIIYRGHCFAECAALQEIIIENGVTELVTGLFSKCDNLVSVSLPKSVKGINKFAFFECMKLKNVSFSEGLEWIGESAFAGCDSLESVVLPDGVTRLDNGAFTRCTKLKSINLPDGITVLNEDVFFGCTELNEIILPMNLCEIKSSVFCGTGIQSIEFPKSLTNIGKYAFSGTQLEKLTIPGHITPGVACFASCEKLYEVVVENGVMELPESIFNGCTSLKNVSLPKSVIKINPYAFANCNELEGILLPEGLVYLGAGAFQGCIKLKRIILPDGLTVIEENLFKDCISLMDVEFPRGAITLGGYAFDNCDSLRRIEFPKYLANIGFDCFISCDELENIIFSEGIHGIGMWSFWWINNKPPYITLSSDIQEIIRDAVKGCIFRVPEGSNTQKYLEANGYTGYELIPPVTESEDEREEKATAHSKIEKIAEADIGDTVIFGSYEQDNDYSNGKEDVEWQVLDKKEGKVLLLSKYALEACPFTYKNVCDSWTDSYIRQWLNGGFLWKTFTDAEYEYISSESLLDEFDPYHNVPGFQHYNYTENKLFLLSYDEVLTYFDALPETCDVSRQTKMTEYAKAHGGWSYNSDIGDFTGDEYDGNCSWWLRTSGRSSDSQNYLAVCVNFMGSVDPWGSYVINETKGMRPAMWVNVTTE